MTINRTAVITGTCLSLLGALSIAEYWIDRSEVVTQPLARTIAAGRAPVETVPLTVGELISSYMTSLETEETSARVASLTSLLDELERPEYASAEIPKDIGEALAAAALAALEQSGEESAPIKGRVAKLVAGRLGGPSARVFIVKALDDGPAELRDQVLAGLEGPRGHRGPEIFERIQKLGSEGLIASRRLPVLLERTGGKKAIEPIAAVMVSTDDWRTVSACAIALQKYGDPALLGRALERLDQIGVLDNPKRLPWISHALLSKQLESAEGDALGRGIRAMKSRPSLAKGNLAVMARGLDHGDPAVRRHAAETVKRAVLARRVPKGEGEKLLTARLESETEPVLKAELSGGLEQVRGLVEEEPAVPQVAQ